MNAVCPSQLATVLDDHGEGIEVLSLDCFDTLIWRDVNSPRDVFADLHPLGVGLHQRVVAETRARDRARLSTGRDEVSIEAIYDELFLGDQQDARGSALAGELAAEARHCFAFRPTVELMKAARRQGLKVIIVSDTYLSADQLRALIARAAGTDVSDMIDAVFCSSQYGMSKAGGLFRPVLRALGTPSDRVLHIGDNKAADLDAPNLLGIRALHIEQFDEEARDRLRLEGAVGSLFDPRLRVSAPLYQPHRPAIALAHHLERSELTRLGYDTLGPIFYGFARWLRDEAASLATAGGKVHLLFLLRDGYLPKLVFEALGSGVPCTTAQISRFTAIGASFIDEAAVLAHVERTLSNTPTEVVARQLLFEDREIRQLINVAARTDDERAYFVRHIRKPRVMRMILDRSARLAERLVEHVRVQTDAQPGDGLVLVDLGYAGSVQNYLQPVLERDLGVAVAGRYLLLREHDIRGDDKRGMIDARTLDGRALNAMCLNVAVVEQLSTVALGSVVDYEEDGTPVLSDSVIKGAQSAARSDVQAACVAFALDCMSGYHSLPQSGTEGWVQAATSALARLMFLPMHSELTALSAFEHDVNLGTDQSLQLFDQAHASQSLRRQGPFYVNGVNRMFLPAELRGEGFPLSMTLMAGRRFELDLRQADFQDRTVMLPIIVADGATMIDSTIEAFPTHDGFLVASIPVGVGRYAIGVRFAAAYEWLQLEAASFVPQARIGAADAGARDAITADCLLESIEAVSGSLLHCQAEHGFALFPPPAAREPMVLNVVFRPLVLRDQANAAARADDPVAELAEVP